MIDLSSSPFHLPSAFCCPPLLCLRCFLCETRVTACWPASFLEEGRVRERESWVAAAAASGARRAERRREAASNRLASLNRCTSPIAHLWRLHVPRLSRSGLLAARTHGEGATWALCRPQARSAAGLQCTHRMRVRVQHQGRPAAAAAGGPSPMPAAAAACVLLLACAARAQVPTQTQTPGLSECT